MSHIYIGLDLGSTSLKIAAFEGSSGAVLAQASAAIPWQRASTGACQVPGSVLRQLVTGLLGQVSHQLGARAANVAAIACVGHGGGLYVVDAEGALQDDFAVSSTDQRATQITNALAQREAQHLFNTVGSGPWSGQPSMIAADIARLKPDAFQHASTLFFAKDFVAMVLSGERATDYSDASTAGLLNSTTRCPSELAFEVANIPQWRPGLLARLQDSGSPLGQLLPSLATQTGLPASIPIAMGSIDLYGAMAGVGATQAGDVAAVLGTWCVNAAIGPSDGSIATLLNAAAAGISNVVLLDSKKSVMYMNNSAAAMANTTWLASTLQHSATHLLDAAFSSEPGAHGLRYIPFINGGGDASAGFLGLRAFHTPADMARAGFTVSNLGLLGAEEFVALVNPPEVGILAVGAFVPTPVVRDGQVVVRDVARLTVSGDHRAVDGADAAALLSRIRDLLEGATRLLAD